MARAINKLSDRKIKGKLSPGRHSDGGGLYLNVSDTDARSWLFMWKTASSKRREMGLGSLLAVPLVRAREKAGDARRQVAEGLDPIAVRDGAGSKTFGETADALIASMSSGWRNAKHRWQWEMTLREYCAPIRPKPVAQIGIDDVLETLKPLWQAKPVTGSRLRGRIEKVLDYAKARGWRSGENPARWRGHLNALLPKPQKLTRGHHAAMPYASVPAFMASLRAREGFAAALLEFIVLTAARTGEARGARWSEMDLDAKVWTVPATRMKGGREHRVPLSERAIEILKAMAELRRDDALVFPSAKPDKPLSDATLRRMADNVTTHGFRSSFRDWAGEETHFPREVAEAALAHVVGDTTERAYRRGDAIEKRRALMEAWAVHCGAEPAGSNVLRFKVGSEVWKK
jgi:integrase